jgi:hypothetical protein
MKTLFERLKPELILAMNAEAELYPNIMKSLKTELEKHYFFNDMTIANAYRLTDLTKHRRFGITELNDCFDSI